MPFHLWQHLTPEMEGESIGGSAEDAHKVILPSLDGLFGNVATVIIGRHQLICHACGLNFGSICFRNLIVQDLVGGDDSLYFHSHQGTSLRQDHLAFGPVFYRFHPSGVAVDVVEDHLVVIPAAGLLGEASSLIRKQRRRGLIDGKKNILFLLECNRFFN